MSLTRHGERLFTLLARPLASNQWCLSGLVGENAVIDIL
jgi:hypothetical protein